MDPDIGAASFGNPRPEGRSAGATTAVAIRPPRSMFRVTSATTLLSGAGQHLVQRSRDVGGAGLHARHRNAGGSRDGGGSRRREGVATSWLQLRDRAQAECTVRRQDRPSRKSSWPTRATSPRRRTTRATTTPTFARDRAVATSDPRKMRTRSRPCGCAAMTRGRRRDRSRSECLPWLSLAPSLERHLHTPKVDLSST